MFIIYGHFNFEEEPEVAQYHVVLILTPKDTHKRGFAEQLQKGWWDKCIQSEESMYEGD